MASAKIATLIIRTIAKPISNQLKNQAKQHETFRTFCVDLAQRMHRTEINLRTRLLGEPSKHIRPLSETRAVENGANALAEGFLFAVAAAIIIGEQWRSSRSQSKRKEDVDDKLEALDESVKELNIRLGRLSASIQEELEAERKRSTDLARILERVVEIGLHGGWSELEQTPLRLPRIDLSSSLNSSSSQSESESSSLSESNNENDSDSGTTSSSEDGRIDTKPTGIDDKDDKSS